MLAVYPRDQSLYISTLLTENIVDKISTIMLAVYPRDQSLYISKLLVKTYNMLIEKCAHYWTYISINNFQAHIPDLQL
jgi:hypothetical protein